MTQEKTTGLPEKIEGLLVHDTRENKLIRIIDERRGFVRAVEIHPTQLNIKLFESLKFGFESSSGRYQVVEEEPRIVDENRMNERDKKSFHERLSIIEELKRILNDDLLDFGSHTKGAEVNRMLKEHGTSRRCFRIWLIRYLQSGQQKWSLVNHFKIVNGKIPTISRNIQHKLGRKSRLEQGKVLDEYDMKAFAELLKLYKENIGDMSFANCWRKIRQQYYNQLTLTGTGTARVLVPENQFPTAQQARYYVDQRLTPEEKLLARKTKKQIRNDNRLLNSDSRRDALGPMSLCESDAWEPGIILVDPKDPGIKLGKPSICAIVDVYTGAIVTFYITYDKDTAIGLTSMMMSLLDDKSSLKEGRDNPDAVWFPGSYLPVSLRIDRGSNYVSDVYAELCRRLDIVKEPVPGALGSYKSNVEKLWDRVDKMLIDHMKKRGVITHVYGEKPYKDALFTMDEFRQIVIEAVIALNAEPVLDYPMTDDMIRAGVDLTPKSLWEYGVRKNGEPRGIVNREQFMFDLMFEDTAKTDRSGTIFKGLYYDNPEDKRLQNLRFKTQNKKVPLTIRYDPRSVNHIWYRWEDEPSYRQMSLMLDKTGMKSFENMPFQKYMVYREIWMNQVAHGKHVKERIKSAAYHAEEELTNAIVKSKKGVKKNNSRPTHEDIFNARMEEREATTLTKKFSEYSSKDIEPDEEFIPADAPAEPEEPTRWTSKGYENALLMFDDDDDDE